MDSVSSRLGIMNINSSPPSDSTQCDPRVEIHSSGSSASIEEKTIPYDEYAKSDFGKQTRSRDTQWNDVIEASVKDIGEKSLIYRWMHNQCMQEYIAYDSYFNVIKIIYNSRKGSSYQFILFSFINIVILYVIYLLSNII